MTDSLRIRNLKKEIKTLRTCVYNGKYLRQKQRDEIAELESFLDKLWESDETDIVTKNKIRAFSKKT